MQTGFGFAGSLKLNVNGTRKRLVMSAVRVGSAGKFSVRHAAFAHCAVSRQTSSGIGFLINPPAVQPIAAVDECGEWHAHARAERDQPPQGVLLCGELVRLKPDIQVEDVSLRCQHIVGLPALVGSR